MSTKQKIIMFVISNCEKLEKIILDFYTVHCAYLKVR